MHKDAIPLGSINRPSPVPASDKANFLAAELKYKQLKSNQGHASASSHPGPHPVRIRQSGRH
jgi:hypothetical protein